MANFWYHFRKQFTVWVFPIMGFGGYFDFSKIRISFRKINSLSIVLAFDKINKRKVKYKKRRNL